MGKNIFFRKRKAANNYNFASKKGGIMTNRFFNENKKNIIMVLILTATLYLIYIFAEYWSVAVEAFQNGWNKY